MKLYLICDHVDTPTLKDKLFTIQSIREYFQIDRLRADPFKEIELYKNYNQVRRAAVNKPIFEVECSDTEVDTTRETFTTTISKVEFISASVIHTNSNIKQILQIKDFLAELMLDMDSSEAEEESSEAEKESSEELPEPATPVSVTPVPVMSVPVMSVPAPAAAPIPSVLKSLARRGFNAMNATVSALTGASVWYFASGPAAQSLPSLGYDPIQENFYKELALAALATGSSFFLLKQQIVKNAQKALIAKAIAKAMVKGMSLFIKKNMKAPAQRDEFDSPQDELNYRTRLEIADINPKNMSELELKIESDWREELDFLLDDIQIKVEERKPTRHQASLV